MNNKSINDQNPSRISINYLYECDSLFFLFVTDCPLGFLYTRGRCTRCDSGHHQFEMNKRRQVRKLLIKMMTANEKPDEREYFLMAWRKLIVEPLSSNKNPFINFRVFVFIRNHNRWRPSIFRIISLIHRQRVTIIISSRYNRMWNEIMEF
jgi:hypothetical protein